MSRQYSPSWTRRGGVPDSNQQLHGIAGIPESIVNNSLRNKRPDIADDIWFGIGTTVSNTTPNAIYILNLYNKAIHPYKVFWTGYSIVLPLYVYFWLLPPYLIGLTIHEADLGLSDSE